jgi:hypothetical protein
MDYTGIMNIANSSNRLPVPEPMKREVRQRCGFGCVICGFPLYTYEHILGYANVKRHVASDLTLLCDQHQRESTSRLLPREDIIRADQNPYNLRQGISKPYLLHYGGSNCIADIGKNVFVFQDTGDIIEFIALAIDEDPIVSFKLDNGHWLLNLRAFDKNDGIVARITDNELVYSTSPWDIELVGRNLVIREAERKILLDLLFEPPSQIKVQRGHFQPNGIEVDIGQNYLDVLNIRTRMAGNCGSGVYGINLGEGKGSIRWGIFIGVERHFRQTSQSCSP